MKYLILMFLCLGCMKLPSTHANEKDLLTKVANCLCKNHNNVWYIEYNEDNTFDDNASIKCNDGSYFSTISLNTVCYE